MNTAGQASALVNIVSRVNVHDAVDLGKAQMEEYEASWPEGFHQPIKKRVCTMKECKKKTRTDTAEQFDSGLIVARALGLMKSRDVKVEQILSYELAPVPSSEFEEKTRDLRIAKSKSILKNKLQVEQSARATGQPDAIVIDGCAILWVIHWPSKEECKTLSQIL